MIAKVLLIGWQQICAMAQDETKRFSLSRHGAARKKMIAKSRLKLRNSQPRFGARRNLRLKLRSRLRPASLHCAEYGPIPSLRVFQHLSRNSALYQCCRSYSEFAQRRKTF